MSEAIEFAEQEFRFGQRQKDGSSLKDHVDSAASQGWGATPIEEVIEIKELPTEFTFVWRDFLQLNSARSSNGFGLNPLSYTEILSFYTLLQISPEPWEVTMIKVFDKVSLKVFQEEQERDSKKNKKNNHNED